MVAGAVFGRRSVASLVRELGRNPALLAVCGFDPLPRQSRPRRAVERVEGVSRVVWSPPPRRDSVLSFEFEQHFIRGLSRMRTRVGLALSVMMALALGQVRAGHPERMRSLYGPVPPAFAGAGSGPTPADRPVALKSSRSGPAGQSLPPRKRGGRLVRAARTGAFCPSMNARGGALRPSSGAFAPRGAASRVPVAAGRHGPPARKPYSAHASRRRALDTGGHDR